MGTDVVAVKALVERMEVIQSFGDKTTSLCVGVVDGDLCVVSRSGASVVVHVLGEEAGEMFAQAVDEALSKVEEETEEEAEGDDDDDEEDEDDDEDEDEDEDEDGDDE